MYVAMVVSVLAIYLAAIWLTLVFWTYRDIRPDRIRPLLAAPPEIEQPSAPVSARQACFTRHSMKHIPHNCRRFMIKTGIDSFNAG